MGPNQNLPSNNIPSIKQPGEWSPLMDFSNDAQPPPQSFFSKYKKLIIITAVSILVLVGLVIFGLMSSGSQTTDTQGLLSAPKTDVALSDYDQEKFSMKYASNLNILEDQKVEDGDGWFLLLSEDAENPTYSFSVYVTTQDPLFASDQEAFNDQLDEVQAENIISSPVVLAGYEAQKVIGEIVENETEYYVASCFKQIGEQFVTINAKYVKDNKDLHDSFDAMIGSIRLK